MLFVYSHVYMPYTSKRLNLHSKPITSFTGSGLSSLEVTLHVHYVAMATAIQSSERPHIICREESKRRCTRGWKAEKGALSYSEEENDVDDDIRRRMHIVCFGRVDVWVRWWRRWRRWCNWWYGVVPWRRRMRGVIIHQSVREEGYTR